MILPVGPQGHEPNHTTVIAGIEDENSLLFLTEGRTGKASETHHTQAAFAFRARVVTEKICGETYRGGGQYSFVLRGNVDTTAVLSVLSV